MLEPLAFAVLSLESASMLLALIAWVVGTVWLLHTAARTERGLWEIRKGRTSAPRKNPKVGPAPKRYV